MDEPQTNRKATVGWFAIWLLTFLASLVPVILHRWSGIAEIIEPFRYPWGLLPADLLFLRHFGELAHWIPVILVIGLIIAIRKPSLRRPLVASGAALTAVFSSIYAGYAVIIVSMYLRSYSNAMEGNTDMLQELYVKPTQAEPQR